MAGQPQARQRLAGAASKQAIAVDTKAHQHTPTAGKWTAADALEDGWISGHDDPLPGVALRLNVHHREGFNRCPTLLSRPSWSAWLRTLPRPCRRGRVPPFSTSCWERPPPRAATSPTPFWRPASRVAGAHTRAVSARIGSRSRLQLFVFTSIFTRSRVQTRTGSALASRRNASRVAIEASTPDLPFSPRSSVMPLSRATRRTTPSETCGLRLPPITCQAVLDAVVANRLSRNAT